MQATAEQAAFLVAISAESDEDTPRLAYADWLDEQHVCPDAGRAELIRVQCELAQSPPNCVYACGSRIDFRCKWCGLRDRERDLLAAHGTRWRAGPKCEKCEGRGSFKATYDVHGRNRRKCEICYGSGDAGGLLRFFTRPDDGSKTARPDVHFRRGFVERVDVPTLADCVAEEHRPLHGSTVFTVPTPWLRSVLRHHPTVREVVPLCRKPNATEYGMTWNRDRDHHRSTDGIPSPIFDLMELQQIGRNYKVADSVEAAVTALARALAAFGRQKP